MDGWMDGSLPFCNLDNDLGLIMTWAFTDSFNLLQHSLSLPSCWLLSESWHKTWIINAQSRCYEALHNVFTRFQSGPPFYFFMTVVWHWSLAPFILCSRFRHFYYSHPWWGYMIPLASNIGRPHEVPETSCLCARDSKPLLNLIHGSASTAPTMTPSLHYFE